MQARAAMVPMIMCGGSGERLWPLSRSMLPKPFVELPQGGTLIAKLLSGLPKEASAPVFVTVAGHEAACQAAYATSGLAARFSSSAAQILAEPMQRNTAVAVAMAARYAQVRFGAEAVLAFLPADHWIERRDIFNQALATGVKAAAAGERLTLLGIEPRNPATGYGYIEAGKGEKDWLPVKRFVEKPDRPAAESMIAAGGNYWNAGIFIGTASLFLSLVAKHSPPLGAAASKWSPEEAGDELNVAMPPKEIYEGLETISFDRAVAEKAVDVGVVPVAESGWSDVGSWDSFAELLPAAGDGNRVSGEAKLESCSGTKVLSTSERLVAAAGCEELSIIDTPDALLVAGSGSQEPLQRLIAGLADDPRLNFPVAEKRPWGSYRQLGAGEGWKVKRIEVTPGCRLSLQSHEHRAEQWIVVDGEMTVVVGEKKMRLKAGEACHIPSGAQHRMANETDSPAALIEVQTGSYLGEDDVKRYEDDFSRG